MIPEIIRIGPFQIFGISLNIPVHSFGLMVALAFFALIYRLGISFRNNGINPELAEKYVFVGGVSGLIGARLWFIGEEFSSLKGHYLEALLANAGFTFFGGFIAAAAVLIALSRFDKLSLSDFLDSVGPALTLGYAIGRLGCQLSGEQHDPDCLLLLLDLGRYCGHSGRDQRWDLCQLVL